MPTIPSPTHVIFKGLKLPFVAILCPDPPSSSALRLLWRIVVPRIHTALQLHFLFPLLVACLPALLLKMRADDDHLIVRRRRRLVDLIFIGLPSQ